MSTFYAVGHGFKRGIYEKWADAKEQIDGFPQPVYKKFTSRDEADEYLKEREPTHVELSHPEPKYEKYYAVARGKTVGVFTDYNKVKESIADYPQPLHKKFEDLNEAVSYFEKFFKGTVKDSDTSDDNEEKSEKKKVGKKAATPAKKAASGAQAYYAVARGHKTGVYLTWAECQEQTKDFKGARFKKFENEEDAKMFAAGKKLADIEAAKKKRPASDDDSDDEPATSSKKKRKSE